MTGKAFGSLGSPTRGRSSVPAVPLLLLVVVTVIGGWLRVTRLAEAPLIGDELNHYNAAMSLKEEGAPLLPSGHRYTRGLDITRLVAVTSTVIRDPALAARLPSALFGTLALVLIALVAWSLAGPWAAVWAATLLAIYPEAVLQSRQTRFYTYQLCYGLVALYAGWKVLEPRSSNDGIRRWLWAGLTLLAFGLAARVQVTSLSVAAGWGTAVLLFAARDVFRGRGRSSVALQLSLLGVLGGAIAVLGWREGLANLFDLATHVPVWAGSGGDVRAYYWALADSLPVLVTLAPVLYLALLIKWPPLGAYLLCWFVVPFAIHSVVLPWKAERYIFLATAGFLLAAALAADMGARRLSAAVRGFLLDRFPGLKRMMAARVAGALVLCGAAFAVATSRAFSQARHLPTAQQPADWSRAYRIILENGLGDAPKGASQALVPLYYWGELDFVVGVDFLENRAAEAEDPELRPDGSPDWYSGLPVLTRPRPILDRFPTATSLVIAIDRGRWDHGNIAPDLRSALHEEGTELCQNRCGNLLLFHWSPRGRGSSDAPDTSAASPSTARTRATGPARP